MYEEYSKFIKEIVDKNDLTNFKRNRAFTQILEHVTKEQGISYYQLLTTAKINQMREFAVMNDSIGNPVTMAISSFQISPTSLRYLYHAHLILGYLKTLMLKEIRIAEIGGGYGGLCLAIDFVNRSTYRLPIRKYTIIDLDEPVRLQTLYLSRFRLGFTATSQTSKTVDANFLISNYAFSEFDEQTQKEYINQTIKGIPNGFMVWNGKKINFGKKIKIEEPEKPQTGKTNTVIYF